MWKSRITILHQHHPISQRTEGNFCPEVCVPYDPEVRHRIVKPHEPARVGNQKKRGGGVIPQRGLGFPLQLAFLTVTQESGLFPFPHQGGPPMREFEHRKQQA